jgi:hypothetical protein
LGTIEPATSHLVSGSESMQIFTHLTANDVQLRPFPFKRELSMEAYLIENEGVLALDRDTFSDVEIIEDELTLKQGGGNQIRDGRIDILATYSQEYIAIFDSWQIRDRSPLILFEFLDLEPSDGADYDGWKSQVKFQLATQ